MMLIECITDITIVDVRNNDHVTNTHMVKMKMVKWCRLVMGKPQVPRFRPLKYYTWWRLIQRVNCVGEQEIKQSNSPLF